MKIDALARTALDSLHIRFGHDFNPFSKKDAGQHLNHVFVFTRKKAPAALENGDTAPEAAHRLRKLKADITAAKHDQVLGYVIEFECFNVGKGFCFTQAG